jgi:hypothetical protein
MGTWALAFEVVMRRPEIVFQLRFQLAVGARLSAHSTVQTELDGALQVRAPEE